MCKSRLGGLPSPWLLALLLGLAFAWPLCAEMTNEEKAMLETLKQHLVEQVRISTTLASSSESKSAIIARLEKRYSEVSALLVSFEQKLEQLEQELKTALTELDNSEQSRQEIEGLLTKAQEDLKKVLESYNLYKAETDLKIAALEIEKTVWKTTGLVAGIGLVIVGGVVIVIAIR